MFNIFPGIERADPSETTETFYPVLLCGRESGRTWGEKSSLNTRTQYIKRPWDDKSHGNSSWIQWMGSNKAINNIKKAQLAEFLSSDPTSFVDDTIRNFRRDPAPC